MKQSKTRIVCPTCGHSAMKRVKRTIITRRKRSRVSVPNVEVDECPQCGERLYDLSALAVLRHARQAAGRGSAA